MDKQYELKHHRLEETNWWFRGRRDMIVRLLFSLNIPRDAHVLDVGCAGGSLLKYLESLGFIHTYGIDLSDAAIARCKYKGLNILKMDATQTRFQEQFFDVIIASDVLEHIQEQHAALAEWYRILKRGGLLVIFVPAFSLLWSRHDEVLHHYRRYSAPTFREVLRKAHFRIIRLSYWNCSLFFPISFIRLLQHFIIRERSDKDQLYELPQILNQCLIALLKLENWILQKFNFSFGVSLFAVAKKE